MLTDTSANIFLAFISLPALLLLTFVGGLVLGRRFFFQTACLIGFEVIVNVALKGTFKIAGSVDLEAVSYVFPSGHMQMATVFYTWLALYIPFWSCRAVIAILLAGIGASLIHFGYHSLDDVIGGIVFGVVLVSIYYYSLPKIAQFLPWILLVFTSMLMIYNSLVYATIPHHAWIAYAILSALILTERIIAISGKKCHCWLKN